VARAVHAPVRKAVQVSELLHWIRQFAKPTGLRSLTAPAVFFEKFGDMKIAANDKSALSARDKL
jgi:hypothetical protein